MENKDEDDVENSAMIMATKKPAKAGTSKRGRAGKAMEGTSTEAPTAMGEGKEK